MFLFYLVIGALQMFFDDDDDDDTRNLTPQLASCSPVEGRASLLQQG